MQPPGPCSLRVLCHVDILPCFYMLLLSTEWSLITEALLEKLQGNRAQGQMMVSNKQTPRDITKQVGTQTRTEIVKGTA